MSNFKVYPFQKNKYFYGKLLTVRDFELEQKYGDEKRYMLNRFMYGSGIICGLRVIMIDEQTISIEPGIAIDSLGREIVVPSPLTQKLSLIEGFENNSYSKALYLCLQYKESGKERVHATSGSVEESQYNRIQEGYDILIKEKIEDSILKKNIDLSHKNVLLYEDADVIVKMKHPNLINVGEIFEVYTYIEKKRKDAKIELDYAIKSEGAVFADRDISRVYFKEPIESDAMSFEVKFLMKSQSKANEHMEFMVSRDYFNLKIDGKSEKLENSILSSYKIIEENKKERLLLEYNNKTLEEFIAKDDFDYVYLAKIEIIQVGSTYIIKKVNEAPFNQYIYNNNAVKNLAMIGGSDSSFNINTDVTTEIVNCNEDPDVNINYNYVTNQFKFNFKMPKNQLIFENIVTGTVDIEVDENFKFGKNFTTDEIDHGLGLGPVYIHAGIEEGFEDDITDDEAIFYGASEVFYKSDFESNATSYALGSVVYPKKGTFRIGLRLQASKKGKIIRLRWWAYKNLSGIDQKSHIKVIINPSEIELQRGDVFQFSGVVHGNEGDDLIWSVEGENSGSVDEFGLYTAPDEDGVFNVRAMSKSDPTKTAIAIVSVKNPNGLASKIDLSKLK